MGQTMERLNITYPRALLSNQEIGNALIISNRTVATHVEHILDKLSAPNRAAAAAYALREGFIMGHVTRYDQ